MSALSLGSVSASAVFPWEAIFISLRFLIPSSRARGSVSPSPVAEAPSQTFPESSEPGKRPRGRRGGPLSAETRLRTAVKRSLGLVCPTCKTRKVTCLCYDLSKLEEAYLASQRSSTLLPRPALENSHRVRSLSQSTTNDYLPWLAPERGEPTPPHELADSDLDEPLNSPQAPVPRLDVHRFATEFNVDSVRTGFGTLSTSNTSYYNPGLGPITPFESIPQPFAIGTETQPCYSGRWRCEFPVQPNATSPTTQASCCWSGPLAELEQHWRCEHHAYRDSIISCHCLQCGNIQMVEEPPDRCESQACSSLPRLWKRCMFGHTLVESTIASTPALTTGDSESVYSFDRVSPYE
ncbi:hypothetical protein PG989_016081 [Apiospora arundinis]